MGLSGNLNTMSFADLLQFLSANPTTGTLQVRRGHILKMVFFDKGKIISSSSSDPRDYLGNFLVSLGMITEQELTMAMDIQRSSKMLLGKILVMGGKVSETDMVRLLQIKTEETIYSLFLWDEGEFVFYQDELMDRLHVRISLDPQTLIFEGVMRRDDSIRFREIFISSKVIPLRVEEKVLGDEKKISPEAKSIYERVDGILTIEGISRSAHRTEYEVCKALYELYENGYLTVADASEEDAAKTAQEKEHTFLQMKEVAQQKLAKGRFEEALDILRELNPSGDGYDQFILPLLQKAEEGAIRDIYAKYLPPGSIPVPVLPAEKLSQIHLSPQEGFVLSRLDGVTNLASILTITPVKEIDALRILKKLAERGIVGLRGAEDSPFASKKFE